jgi:hypothetical protein
LCLVGDVQKAFLQFRSFFFFAIRFALPLDIFNQNKKKKKVKLILIKVWIEVIFMTSAG